MRKKMMFGISLVVLFLVAYFTFDRVERGFSKGNEVQMLTPERDREAVQLKTDIVYKTVENRSLKLNVLLPKNHESSCPLIIYIKGGGWGWKKPIDYFAFIPQLTVFAKEGYVVASIEHRTSREAIFPAQIYDVKQAIVFLKQHATEYGIDPERVGIWGSSSGGHLAALAGTTGNVGDLAENEEQVAFGRVQAVVDWYGPTDFLQAAEFHNPASSESILIGGPVQENQDKVRLANPITYISADDPPFLIMHGDQDRRVPYQQSELLFHALKKANINVSMYNVKGAGHGGAKFTAQETLEIVQQFFDEHLKK